MPAPKGRPKPVASGRKPGIKNVTTPEARAIAQYIVQHPKVQARLLQQAIDGTLRPEIEILLWHYAYGKPREQIEVTGPNGGPIQLFEVVLNWQPLPHQAVLPE
jgi:hypothetical protein